MKHPPPLLSCALLCAAAFLGAPPGCASGDKKAGTTSREDQLRASLAQTDLSAAPPELREELKSLAWKRSESPGARMVAIEALLEGDQHDTLRMLNLMLPTETDWTLLERVCEMAADRNWTGLTAGLVRSWSRQVVTPPDDARPEGRALARLHPDRSVEGVVFGVFADTPPPGPFAERTRLDAWTLLRRLDAGGSRTVALLLEGDATGDDELLADIRAGARDLGSVPETGEQLDWLRSMRGREHRAFWAEASEAVALLDERQREGLALRHAPIVRWAAAHRPEWLTRSRDQLRGEALSRLDGRRTHARTGGSGNVALRETIRAWDSDLAWGDLLAILVADEAIASPGLAAEMFRQADLDHVDTSTEYGGVLTGAEGADAGSAPGFVATLHVPRAVQRMGDQRFVAPPEMIEGGADALFHYHFHADRIRNANYAGPSEGDTSYADLYGRACLVLTFINRSVLNVDYYQPGGARVDLGELHRH